MKRADCHRREDRIGPKNRRRTRLDADLPAAAAYTYRWDFCSYRLQRLVSGAGISRLDYFVWLECDPQLESYTPFPTLEIKQGTEVRIIRADAIAMYRDGSKVLAFIGREEGLGEAPDGDDAVRRQWAAAKNLKYSIISTEEIRTPTCYLENCYAIFPWLAELHEPSNEDSRAVLGAITMHGGRVPIAAVAQVARVDREVVMAAVCRAYVRGIICIDEVRTRILDYDSKVYPSPN